MTRELIPQADPPPLRAVRRGWVPDDLTGCPETALDWLAHGLALDPTTVADLLAAYGGWQGETRRKHRGVVLARLRWRLCGAGERKLLDVFLLARALEHDAPGVLLNLACDWLRAERIARPPIDSLTRRVAAARAETHHRLAPRGDALRGTRGSHFRFKFEVH